MDDIELIAEHSVEVAVSLDFAWRFRTDIATWDDPPADTSRAHRQAAALRE